MKKILTVTIIILGVITLLTQITSIYVSNTRSLQSIQASELREKLAKLKEKNLLLQSKVLSFASYNTISSKAAELGYKESKDFVSLYDPVEVAVKR